MNKKIFYWDTSAILPLVFQEIQSKKVKAFVEKEMALPGYTSFFTRVEMESALNRRIMEGSLSSEVAEVRMKFKELESGLFIIWPTTEILKECCQCVSEFNLRPPNALHLASCLALAKENPFINFVGLDERLNKSATASQLNCVF